MKIAILNIIVCHRHPDGSPLPIRTPVNVDSRLRGNDKNKGGNANPQLRLLNNMNECMFIHNSFSSSAHSSRLENRLGGRASMVSPQATSEAVEFCHSETRYQAWSKNLKATIRRSFALLRMTNRRNAIIRQSPIRNSLMSLAFEPSDKIRNPQSAIRNSSGFAR